MGVISDAIDALEDWCKDLFKDGIKSQFDSISDLLTDTFAQTTGSGGSCTLYSIIQTALTAGLLKRMKTAIQPNRIAHFRSS